MIQRFAALAWPPGAPLPDALPWPKLEADREAGEQLRERLQLTAARPVLALCPGAEFGPAKRWPAIYYARVAETLIGAGWQVWLFGSGNDKPVTGTLAEALSPAAREHCCDLAGQTRLGEAIDLLAQADAVVSNDSGADAYRRRSGAAHGRGVRLHLPGFYAAAGAEGGDPVRAGGLRPLLPAGVPSGAHEMPDRRVPGTGARRARAVDGLSACIWASCFSGIFPSAVSSGICWRSPVRR